MNNNYPVLPIPRLLHTAGVLSGPISPALSLSRFSTLYSLAECTVSVSQMQMLHCISQVPTEGGENQFADGFHGAAVLKRRHPEMFKLLTSTLVDNIDRGFEEYRFFKLSRHPVIA